MIKSQFRKIAVIGTINCDTVVRPDGRRSRGYGGILYNLIVLSRLGDGRLEIWPVVNVGRDHDKQIRSRISELPKIRSDSVRTVSGPNNHCLLKYENSSDKTEKLSGWVGAVGRQQLRKIVDSDCILVNFISGSDISNANLIWLRSQTRAMVYIDFHSRTLGRRADGTRYLRRPRDWRKTVHCADFLQMNEVEFELLSRQQPDRSRCQRFMETEMNKGAQALLVTLGSRGCLVCYRRGTSIVARQVEPKAAKKVIDTTGCGDVFAAAFLSAVMSEASIPNATASAVRVATSRAENPSVENLDFNRLRRKEPS